jgi:hypothetical protein
MPSDGTAYAFVLGTGRCGSTLVQEVLARHPAVGFVSNVDDRYGLPPSAGRWNNQLYRRVPAALTKKGRARFAPSEAYRILEREVSPVLATPFRDLVADDATPWLTARVRTFFEARAEAQAQPVFLHKFTGWPRVGFLDAVFPEARFVHIVRDGRAVANSFLQMPWYRGYGGPERWDFGPLPERYDAVWQRSGRSHVVLAGLAWRILMDAFDDARRAVEPERWLELRYEDVLADPAAAFDRMRSFVGLPPDADFEATVRAHPFHAGRRDAFRTDLDWRSLERLDGALGDVLDAFGYARAA